MKRDLFVLNKGKFVRLALKPRGFILRGTIDEVFDDCFTFTTDQKTSYIDFDMVLSFMEVESER
jgi:hypothetical protein